MGVGKSAVFDWCRKWKERYQIVDRLDSGNYRKVYSLSELLVLHGSNVSSSVRSGTEADRKGPKRHEDHHIRRYPPSARKHNSHRDKK